MHITEDMLLKRFLQWFIQPLAGMGDTTRDDNSLRIDDRGVVSEAET